MKKSYLVINGPNINLTGKREKGIYGNKTYEVLCNKIKKFAKDNNIEVEIIQSNYEGEIIDKIHKSVSVFDGIIINAGAYTHYSYAIRDAIGAINIPVVEVHMSNIFKREDFRHKSVITDVCAGHVSGFGFNSYLLGLYSLLLGD